MGRFQVAPLPGGMMLLGMLGFLVVMVYTAYGNISITWGFTLGFVFALIFIASMISMTKAPTEGPPFKKKR